MLQTNEKLQAWCRKISSGYIFRLCFEEILSKFVVSAKQKEKYNKNSLKKKELSRPTVVRLENRMVSFL